MLSNIIKSKIVFLSFVAFLLYLFWIISFLTIPKESAPAMDLPMYIINIIAPWLDPNTVEKQISIPLEQEFKSITKISKITSVSSFNYSSLIVEFEDTKSKTDAINDMKSAIDKKIWNFPNWVKYPIINQFSPDDSPIYTFSIVWNYLNSVLYEKSRTLEDSLKWVSWVSDIIIIWKPEKNINLDIQYEKLNQYWLDIWMVISQLNWVYFNFPADKKKLSDWLYSYEVSTYEKDINSIIESTKNLDLINKDWQSVKFTNIGTVYYQELVNDKKNFIAKKSDSTNWIWFQIKSTPWADIEKLINEAKTIIYEFIKENPDLKFYETSSMYEQILDIFNTFVSNFRQSWIIVMLFVFIFLWIRASIWISLAFPLVYLTTFLLLNIFGYSFNNIVSFALVLTLWIMVDNLIVITEWVIWEIKKWNISYWEAINISFKKYMPSMIAWTSITIFMFLPLIFWLTWMLWAYMMPLPITIALTLISSLVIALILLPVFSSKFLNTDKEFKKTWWTIILEKIADIMWNILKTLVNQKYKAIIVSILARCLFFSSFYLVWSWIIKTDFLPATDQNNIYINLKYSPWITLWENQQMTNEIYNDINDFFEENYPWEIQFTDISLWSHYSSDATTAALKWTANYLSNLTIKLSDKNDREIKAYQMSENLQSYAINNLLKNYDYLKDIEIIWTMWIWWWKPVWFELKWKDLIELNEYYLTIKPELEKIKWIFNITTNIEYTNWKIKYILDLNKAKELWISVQSASYLVSSIKNSEYRPYWIELWEFNEFDKDPIKMKLFTNLSWSLSNLKIWDNYLSSIIKKKELEPELKAIQHNKWELTLEVKADKTAKTPLWDISKKIVKIVEQNEPPKWISFWFSADVETQEKSSWELWSSLWIWLIFTLIILVLKFNSIKYALIILTTTLMSFMWVLWILAVAWMPLSFPAQLWLFWVIWVWINNWILFIQRYITNKLENMDTTEAVIDAAKSRFIAIFLTTATTISGLVTLALKDELWWGLAVSFIWWLIANFVLVFIYLPAILKTVDNNKN